MKCVKVLLKVAAVLAAVAGVLCLVAAQWDRITARCAACKEFKLPDRDTLREKMPSMEQVREKFRVRESIAKMNPFRRAEIEEEFSDYADCEPWGDA